MADRVQVRAREGVRVPMAGQPRRYIVADRPVVVTLNSYYRRQIRDGDLIVVGPAPTAKAAGPQRRATADAKE